MCNMNHQPWPEVEPPRGWKKNPRAGKRLTWILLLTVAVAGGVTALSAGKSEVLPVVCFLALVALPFAGPIVSRIGYGADYPEARELHQVTEQEMTVEPAGAGCCLTRWRGPYQKPVFPDTAQGMPITAAAGGLLRGNRIIAFVHLPEGLEEIPEEMLMGCDNLPAIVIPPQVKRIGARAFAGCAELKDVYLPASVEEIAPDAFADCRQPVLHVREGSMAERFAKEYGMLTAGR
ncbi:MAG: leucine-rich repeat domain-containing protein [Clostridia bacterium]|nr:leucine-rich repeat domain-containing protein [Clostridia bacterium]